MIFLFLDITQHIILLPNVKINTFLSALLNFSVTSYEHVVCHLLLMIERRKKNEKNVKEKLRKFMYLSEIENILLC